MVVGDTTAKHDGLQVQLLTQFFAILVHTARQAQAAVLGMDEHFDAIQDIAFGIVGVEGLLSCHLRIGVVVLHLIVVDNNRKGATHDFLVHYRHYLPLGKDADKFLYLLVRPEHVAAVGIHTCEGLCQLVIVLYLQVTYLDFVDFN